MAKAAKMQKYLVIEDCGTAYQCKTLPDNIPWTQDDATSVYGWDGKKFVRIQDPTTKEEVEQPEDRG